MPRTSNKLTLVAYRCSLIYDYFRLQCYDLRLLLIKYAYSIIYTDCVCNQSLTSLIISYVQMT